MNRKLQITVLSSAVAACSLVGCTASQPRSPSTTTSSSPPPHQTSPLVLKPEEAEALTSEVAGNWFYGQGLGDTLLTAGAVVAFPPFLAVVVGNAALSLSGHEPVTISGMLPEEEGAQWRAGYDAFTSAPGRVAAAVAGREFRTPEVIKSDLKQKFPALAPALTEGDLRASFRPPFHSPSSEPATTPNTANPSAQSISSAASGSSGNLTGVPSDTDNF